MAPLDGSRKKRFMSHFSLTANTPVFFQSNEIVGNGSKMLFLFGFHLTSSAFNGFVNHFAVSKKNEYLGKLPRTPARWRLQQHGLIFRFSGGQFSATAQLGSCPYRHARSCRCRCRTRCCCRCCCGRASVGGSWSRDLAGETAYPSSPLAPSAPKLKNCSISLTHDKKPS